MHKFWYDYVKPKYGENAKHMDTDIWIQTALLLM